MWLATRRSIRARNEEDAAAAYRQFGLYADRDNAREVLIQAVYDEIQEWTDSDYDTDGYCLRRLDAIVTRLHAGEDVVEVDGLEFATRGRD